MISVNRSLVINRVALTLRELSNCNLPYTYVATFTPMAGGLSTTQALNTVEVGRLSVFNIDATTLDVGQYTYTIRQLPDLLVESGLMFVTENEEIINTYD
jgi:hypothetical protein